MLKGLEAGGQLMLTTEVENYPGFPDGIMGPELMEQMEKQAARFGTEILPVHVTRGRPVLAAVRRVGGRPGVARARRSSSRPAPARKWLGVPGEEKLRGRGVSACATCDGFFFRDRELVVVGGGDTAMEEATFLTKFASKVTIVHRRDEFRASQIMRDARSTNPKIEVIWDTVVEEILGDDAVTGVRLRERQTGEATRVRDRRRVHGDRPHAQHVAVRGAARAGDDGYIMVAEPRTDDQRRRACSPRATSRTRSTGRR